MPVRTEVLLRRAILPALVGLAWSCDAPPADPGGLRTATVRVEAIGPARTSHLVGRASVVAGVTLTVRSADGTSVHEAVLGTGTPVAEFQVRVPDGEVRFEAEVVSNTGVLLYDGVAEATVDGGGFGVEIPLVARRPVLVVEPDTLRVTPAGVPPGPGVFTLRNAGTGIVQWRVAELSPLDAICSTSPCLEVLPTSGTLAASETAVIGRSGVLRVAALFTPARPYVIRLESPEGFVELVVDAAAAGILEARVVRSDGGTAAPLPVSGNQVRLRACSALVAGNPETCIPDASIPPSTSLTDATGITRFRGLPPGLWEIRPDSTGWTSIDPRGRTVSLDPGGFVSVLFQTTAVQAPSDH